MKLQEYRLSSSYCQFADYQIFLEEFYEIDWLSENQIKELISEAAFYCCCDSDYCVDNQIIDSQNQTIEYDWVNRYDKNIVYHHVKI